MSRGLYLTLSFLLLLTAAFMPVANIAELQTITAGWDIGERTAFWAEQFIDVPYDVEPMGEYVREGRIVADERVDCMYLAFRSVELALGKNPSDAESVALEMRFHRKGLVQDGKVVNYEDRFRFGEDMIESGKWGREITSELGRTAIAQGKSAGEHISMIAKEDIQKVLSGLMSGDIIFFVKASDMRMEHEVIGHIGIIKREQDAVYLISAFGQKNKGGKVKKILFSAYSAEMPFIGIQVTRLE